MAANNDYLEALENRISALERRLIGEEKVRDGQPSLIRLINTINGKLEALCASAQVIKDVWTHCDQIERYLKQNKAAKLDERAKEEMILLYTEQLVRIQDQLEDISILKETINAPAFRGLEKEASDVSAMAKKHLAQEKHADILTNQIQAFVDSYTKILMKLSQDGVQWNDKISS